MRKLRELTRKFEKPILILGGAITLTSILVNLNFNLLEANLYDLRMTRGTQPAADPRIVIVTLDDVTTQVLDEFSPLPLDMHVKFMEELEKLDPRSVGYLIDLNQVSQNNPDLADKREWAERFMASAHRMERHGTVFLLGTPYDVTGEVLPPFPLSTLPHAVAVIHKDGNVFAEDKITRRGLVQLNERSVFHLKLTNQMGLGSPTELPRGSFEVPETDSSYFFFRYHGSPVLKNHSWSNLPYPRVSFLDILQGKLAPGSLRGKIILVGTLSRDDSTDYAFTPYSKNSFANPKLAIHANILDSLIHNDGIVRASPWLNWLDTFAVTTFVLSWVLTSTPLAGLLSTVGLTIGILLFGQFLFQVKGLWIRESQPLIGIFVCYYLVVPYRLIREYKKRWDYQRKNELLTQVEELKTNFLSLVTHDLKTPVARIQGLAEVLLRKLSDRAPECDHETLHHIISSTDELNRFISSILELSKTESDELKLQLESKDINQLIERSMEGFKASASAKKVKLQTSLEPLFPIKIDSSLISKVINNLIDNAIKYSPSDSTIDVESREIGEFVQVVVRDQGIGMNEEEMERLFTRFYRVKTTSGVSGTGLGLYLTRFFVEAHRGRVEVSSEKGKGTEFRIYLPIHLEAKARGEERTPETVGLTRRIENQFQSFIRRKKEKANV